MEVLREELDNEEEEEVPALTHPSKDSFPGDLVFMGVEATIPSPSSGVQLFFATEAIF